MQGFWYFAIGSMSLGSCIFGFCNAAEWGNRQARGSLSLSLYLSLSLSLSFKTRSKANFKLPGRSRFCGWRETWSRKNVVVGGGGGQLTADTEVKYCAICSTWSVAKISYNSANTVHNYDLVMICFNFQTVYQSALLDKYSPHYFFTAFYHIMYKLL
jgi:hypothetical protein